MEGEKSLESSRDSVFKMLMYTMMIGAVVALYITLAVSIIEAPDERQEITPPEERPLSSMEVLPGDDANGPVLALRMDYRGLEN